MKNKLISKINSFPITIRVFCINYYYMSKMDLDFFYWDLYNYIKGRALWILELWIA